MNGNEYQKLATMTINPDLNPARQELHALFGMCGEIGELQSIYQKEYQGHPFDSVHAKKELGDDICMTDRVIEYAVKKKMTQEEIEQKLGYKVKIVTDKEENNGI